MRESGFHGPNPEDEFKASVEEVTKEEKKTKKKSRFEQFLERIIPKNKQENSESVEADSQEAKTGFFESSRNLLGKIFGIDKEEVSEPHSTNEEGEFEEPRSFRLGGLFAETSLDTDNSADEAPETLPETPYDTPEAEQTDYIDEEPSTAETAPEEPQIADNEPYDYPETNNIQQEIEELHRQAEQTDSDVRFSDAEAYEPIDRSRETGVGERKEEAGEKTIIERRGGAGAALVGFVAAETLSRSRDKKIRKEAEELKKKVDKNKDEQEFKDTTLETLQRRQQEQIEALQNKRKKAPAEQEHTVRQSRTPEVRHAKPDRKQEAKGPEVAEQQKARIEKQQRSPETPSLSDERLHFQEVEQAAENDIPIESFYERRHEIKDVASTPVKNFATAYKQNAYHDAEETIATDYSEGGFGSSKDLNKELYKDAIKQGATAGIVIVVAVIAVVLLWSLL